VSDDAHLSHLFVTVGDLDAARAFWIGTIGLEVLVDEDGYVRVGGEGGFTMGIERVPDGEAPAVEVVVRVADVDAVYERLTSMGAPCDGPPREMPWGARHIWLRDPDGRPVSIFSSPDQAVK
jgi:catechol 2,3-dioxygenase-like lactoylglutathione lyase family enzyme